MKGSIRTALGFLLVFGAVGGIETGEALIPTLTCAIVGLVLMASGVAELKKA